MNLLDIIIIATILFLVVKGVFRGLIREVASLSGIILGIWLANHFQPQMTAYLKSYLPPTSFLPLISFGVIFTAVLFTCNLMGWFLKLLVKKAFLGGVDRALGAGFALLKGVIITYLMIILLTFYFPTSMPLIAKSKIAPLIQVSYQSIIRLISPGHYRILKNKIMEKKREIGEKILSEKEKDTTK